MNNIKLAVKEYEEVLKRKFEEDDNKIDIVFEENELSNEEIDNIIGDFEKDDKEIIDYFLNNSLPYKEKVERLGKLREIYNGKNSLYIIKVPKINNEETDKIVRELISNIHNTISSITKINDWKY